MVFKLRNTEPQGTSSIQSLLIQLLLGARICQLIAHMENQSAVLENILADGWCTKQRLGFNPFHLDLV